MQGRTTGDSSRSASGSATLGRPAAAAAHDGGYVNVDAEFDERPAAGHLRPAKYDRLAEIKRKYDPTNVFRHNANIQPA